MSSYFGNILNESRDFGELSEALSKSGAVAAVSGTAQVQKAHLCFSLCRKRPLLYVAADESEANKIKETLEAFYGGKVLYFPQNDYCFGELAGASREWEHARLSVLTAALSGDFSAIIATPDAICRRTLPPKLLHERTRTFKVGDSVSMDTLLTLLTEGEYSRSSLVEGQGQFALRGGILDFFPPFEQNPFRLELFGDEIDQISSFDVTTQRRIEQVKSCRIAPARENALSPKEKDILIKSLNELAAAQQKKRKESEKAALEQINKDLEMLQAGIMPATLDRFLNLLYDGVYTLFDFLPKQTLVAVSETVAQAERLRAFTALLSEDIKSALERGRLAGKMAEDLALSPTAFWHECSKFPLLFLNTLPRGKMPLPPTFLQTVTSRQVAAAGGNIDVLLQEIDRFRGSVYNVLVACGSKRRAENLTEILSGNGYKAKLCENEAPPQGVIGIYTLPLSAGIEFPEIGTVILTDGAISGTKARRKKLKKSAGERLRTYNDLAVGDFVVHAAYGIGQYMGINKLTVEGITKDYIKIKYAGTDVLYVPAGQLDLLSKFVSAGDGAKVRLNKMGGTDWAKTKLRVKQSVAEMADQLIELYAARSSIKGYAFSPDTEWQRDFEQRFDFEETEDQLRCVAEIKHDMESETPMDRLLCGDVGFGKTEVALRAAFKCVCDSKQCAILVPTTILAWQHYQTILRRFSGFPVKVEVLSRFRSPKQQAEIIKKLRRGEIDIVVGTHRLLQKDLHFKDLGLVIIDEEQRFGVTHKEKLKDLTRTVDCLTLTATPIPRTLNMALSGIRDMSLIEEAPHNRTPVQTYVVEQDIGLVVEAIRRELRRGGQVFYLHNRVESILQVAAKLQNFLPDANIAVGHGKMAEDALSDVWDGVVKGDTDVLVCTTIIETGVDIPNANTLIIEDADRLGLSQLYQIRGRVGRSERRAYVYFTYRRGKVLNEDAVKRLAAIREFTEFNSGFKIALRDLEIRGAGNILGAQQHGHMESVGYDMYVKLLEEAVAEKKGDQKKTEVECAVDLFIDAHIPESYISDPQQRIDIYKKIAAIAFDDDLSDLFDELLDRFGDIPKPVETLSRIALLRGKAGRLGIAYINHKNNLISMDASKLSLEDVTSFISKAGKGMLFSPGAEPQIACRLPKDENVLARLESLLHVLEGVRGGAK